MSAVDDALDRLAEGFSEGLVYETWDIDIATVRQRLAEQDTEIQRLREARSKDTAMYLRELAAAEARVRALQDGLRDSETLARKFHEAYESLAPAFGYETRPDSAVQWEDVPKQNRALMTATVKAVARALLASSEDSD